MASSFSSETFCSKQIEKIIQPSEEPINENSNLTEKFSHNLKNKDSPILWTQIIGAAVCSTVFMSAGVMHGLTGTILSSLMDPKSEDIIFSTFEGSLFSSIANIGALIGSIISGFVSVWLGQRSSFLIFYPIGMASWIILRFANEVWLLFVSRILQGVVIGATIGSATNYVTEYAYSPIRGRLLAVSSFSLQVGFLAVYLVGSTTLTWRNVGLLCGLTTMAIPFTGMLFLPSSPRWLAIRGRLKESKESLTFFRGKHYNVTPEITEIIKQSVVGKTTVRMQFKALKKKPMLCRFLIISILSLAIHFTGHFAMITYSVTIFQSANVPFNSYLSTILTAITRIIGIIIFFLLSDKVGRKQLFIPAQFLCGICMISVSIFFYLQQQSDIGSAFYWLPVTFLAIFTMFSCITNSVLAVWQSELLSNSVRALGISLIYISYYIGTFSAALSFPYMVDRFGLPWTFSIFGVISFTMVIMVAVFIPETKGKTLEEISDL